MVITVSHWQHQFIDTNHVRLHCVTQGEGDLVILLHSFLEFWYSWRHQLPALSRHFKVVVPDLRGCNDSEKPTNGYDLETLSQDILGLMEALGYSKAHVVGHAWGGTIAWHLAQISPKAVDRLAILNGAHSHQFQRALLNNADQFMRSWRLLALQVPGIPDWLLEQTLPTFVKDFYQKQAVRKGAFSREDTQLYQEALQKPGAIAAALKYYRQLLALPDWLSSLWEPVEPIHVPTLVLWGENDTFLSPKLIDSVTQLVKAPLKIRQVQQCGHWIQQEVPQTVNRELLRFLCEG